MNKNIIVPFFIIITAVFVGGIVLFSGNGKSTDNQLIAKSNNLRELELSVPGMFCAGCTASVEGYVSSEPGVKRVQARLTPTKSATVVYDPTIITKEKIVKNQVFDLYGVSVISDALFKGSVLSKKNQEGVVVPQEIQDKSRQIISILQQKTNEGKDVSAVQNLFNQLNNDIAKNDFDGANILLDTITKLLQNL